jgi:lysophospholipase L1-like esterase
MDYNVAIDELVILNNILVTPPDFYNYFRTHQNEFSDNLHPNGVGYQSMAELWFSVLQ